MESVYFRFSKAVLSVPRTRFSVSGQSQRMWQNFSPAIYYESRRKNISSDSHEKVFLFDPHG